VTSFLVAPSLEWDFFHWSPHQQSWHVYHQLESNSYLISYSLLALCHFLSSIFHHAQEKTNNGARQMPFASTLLLWFALVQSLSNV
jgi:hypothetical protein